LTDLRLYHCTLCVHHVHHCATFQTFSHSRQCVISVDKLHEKPELVRCLGPASIWTPRPSASASPVDLPPVSPPTVSYKPKPHVCSPETDTHCTPVALLVRVDRNSEEPHAARCRQRGHRREAGGADGGGEDEVEAPPPQPWGCGASAQWTPRRSCSTKGLNTMG
jgi:hypothetical protein